MKTTVFMTLLFLMVTCNIKQSGNQNSNLSTTDSLNTGLRNLISKTNETECIDFQKFLRDANLLLTDVLSKKTSFELTSDTLKVSNFHDEPEIIDIEKYIFNKSNLSIHHSLKIKPPNTNFSLYILEARFISKEALDSAFIFLKYQANENINVPGMTYSNDYLARDEKYMFWLHSRCIYSFQNHMKFAKLIKESLSDIVILDSISCRCGAVKCN